MPIERRRQAGIASCRKHFFFPTHPHRLAVFGLESFFSSCPLLFPLCYYFIWQAHYQYFLRLAVSGSLGSSLSVGSAASAGFGLRPGLAHCIYQTISKSNQSINIRSQVGLQSVYKGAAALLAVLFIQQIALISIAESNMTPRPKVLFILTSTDKLSSGKPTVS